ncbi:hypothetical protein NE237_018867 [Protea cynaroides]|uniref:Mitochondrial protein n=1 Tax=Protea cynaroides TaxID=273540 RepID=A0A9Q0QPF7_9MAGN|nr:hypothetical protein NE237_018867 [Protea cynaroides]
MVVACGVLVNGVGDVSVEWCRKLMGQNLVVDQVWVGGVGFAATGNGGLWLGFNGRWTGGVWCSILDGTGAEVYQHGLGSGRFNEGWKVECGVGVGAVGCDMVDMGNSIVFKVLRDNQLYVKKEKCAFTQEEVMFLGHKVGGGTLAMDDNKVRVIKEWGVPTKVTELRSFLGLVNYYRRFIKGYSARAAPLMDLLKKNTAWQ